MSALARAMDPVFGTGRLVAGASLARLTTFRTGGPAEWLFEARSAEELVQALRLADSVGVATTILGGGSNVLVSDAGIRGLVIRTRGGTVREDGAGRVRADAAVTMNGLVRWTVNRGHAGLEAWAGTPGTVGGAVFGNAHFGGRSIGDLVIDVRLASRAGVVRDAAHDEMRFGYDRSRLQTSGEVLVSAAFRVAPGVPAALRAVARESLAYRKRTQPLDAPSAGCVFRNPDPGIDAMPAGIPWSAGALVDRAGLKGAREGDAVVSPTHGNFIVNEGAATARDIRRLIDRCRDTVRDRFGVDLREEIVYLGDFNGDATD